ncbi:hypothetical protein ACFQJ5_16890 [Halomicroarcula sp. GCM10025324]|uniref:hypothetical protein n=1 Tax=Haloarcula TaxID=2237 RepID=UPI0023E8BF72|nr:hypothetical protein [Halomicroarcula sp. ZS-22-S1]
MADANGFVYESIRGPKWKVEFDRRSGGGLRVEAVWTGCGWRVTGREVVTTMRRI